MDKRRLNLSLNLSIPRQCQPKSNTQAEQLAEDVDENVLGFLLSLQDGEDMT
jgi:hypothetical protein